MWGMPRPVMSMQTQGAATSEHLTGVPAGPAVDPEVSQRPQRQLVLNIPKSNLQLMADLIKYHTAK